MTVGAQISGAFENICILSNFFFCNENIHCDPPLEPSFQDGSNDGSHRAPDKRGY